LGALISGAVIIPAGEYSEGLMSILPALNSQTKEPFGRAFFDSYQQTYKKPVPEFVVGTSYESVYILAKLIERIQAKGGDPRSGEQIAAAIDEESTFPTVFEGKTMTFRREDHSALKDLWVITVKGGKEIPIKTIAKEKLPLGYWP
jgi:hypothetical protein